MTEILTADELDFFVERSAIMQFDGGLDRTTADGVAAFYETLEKAGKPRTLLPRYLQDIAGGSFPCWVATPSGGFHAELHLYRSRDERKKRGGRLSDAQRDFLDKVRQHGGIANVARSTADIEAELVRGCYISPALTF